MKRVLFTSAILIAALSSCKKKDVHPGPPDTKQLAGTRSYMHIRSTSIMGNPSSSIADTDTVALNIEYIDDGTINVRSYTLIYNQDQSTDSTCFYSWHETNYQTSVFLTYYRLFNRIEFGISNHISAAGSSGEYYQSL